MMSLKEKCLSSSKELSVERVKRCSFEVYLIKNADNQPMAVFKPCKAAEMKRAFKEVAAYQIDHDHFAGVPDTEFASLSHPLIGWRKQGSLQRFCEGIKLKEDHISLIEASSVRRLAILDIRLLNLDRHSSNLICCGSKAIPIDHNLAFPKYFGECYFIWSGWPQAHTLFSREEKNYINNLCPEKDKELLIKLGIEKEAAELSFFATQALKLGVQMDLTPHQISFLFERRKCKCCQDLLQLPRFKEVLNVKRLSSHELFDICLSDFLSRLRPVFKTFKEKIKICN